MEFICGICVVCISTKGDGSGGRGLARFCLADWFSCEKEAAEEFLEHFFLFFKTSFLNACLLDEKMSQWRKIATIDS